MDKIYQKVKAKSKFFKMLEEYNMGGQPTTSTPAGANPGTLPVTPQPGTATGGVDPKVVAMQQAAAKKAKEAQAKAAQAELAALQKAAKDFPAQQKMMNDRIKALQATIKGATTTSASSPLGGTL